MTLSKPTSLPQVALGVYRHYRTGKLYTVILNTVAHHDVADRAVARVIYVGHYVAVDGNVRPYDCTAEHFLETVRQDDGVSVSRFTWVDAS